MKLSAVFLLLTMSFVCGFSQNVRFLPLGDSYTICEGANWEQSWPFILSKHLNERQVPTVLLGNPSVTGYTTDDLIEYELPLFDQFRPNFVTVLIGVNDQVQGRSVAQFHEKLAYILDHIESAGIDDLKIVLITIPDYSVTPGGVNYAKGRNVTKEIKLYNQVIKKEAAGRNLAIIDIFPSTLKMYQHPELIAEDGLHPSAKEYENWERMILPVVMKELKGKN